MIVVGEHFHGAFYPVYIQIRIPARVQRAEKDINGQYDAGNFHGGQDKEKRITG
jgi:hypothetical protein